MKSKLTIKPKTAESPQYPTLARCKESDFVVLFWNDRRGVVVHSKEATRPIGYGASTDWVPITTKNVWEVLPAGSRVVVEQ